MTATSSGAVKEMSTGLVLKSPAALSFAVQRQPGALHPVKRELQVKGSFQIKNIEGFLLVAGRMQLG